MTLRKKTALGISFIIACLVLVSYIISSIVMERYVWQWEQANTQKNLERAVSVFQEDIKFLDSIAVDWASWDDTCTFVEQGCGDYVANNLVASTYINYQLNFLLVYDPAGNPVYARAFDLGEEKFVGLPRGLREHFYPGSLLLDHEDQGSYYPGVIILPQGPAMVASRPILTSEGQGPVRGTLVMGRLLGPGVIDKLAGRLLLNLSIYTVGEEIPVPGNGSLEGLEQDKVLALGDSKVAGYTLLRDIYGEPALVLEAVLPREVHRLGLFALRYQVISYLVLGLLFCGFILFFLEQNILSRLGHIFREVKEIGEKGLTSRRLEEGSSRDELSVLTREINRMLEKMEHDFEMQKKVEEKLQKSERKFRELHEGSRDGWVMLNKDLFITGCNTSYEEMLGYTLDELRGCTSLDITPARWHGWEAEEIIERQLHARGYSEIYQKEYRRKDGTIIPVEVRSYVTRENGEIKGYWAFVRDITGRKQAETALQLEKDFINAVIDTVGSLVLVLDQEGRIVRVNRSFQEVTGYQFEEVAGCYYWDIFLEEDEVELARTFFSALVPEDFPYDLESNWKTREGKGRLFHWSNTAVQSEDGQIKYYISTGLDITERKESENRLREINEKLVTIIHASPLAVISLDSERKVSSWSSAAERLFGWSEMEVLQRPVPMVPPSRIKEFEDLCGSVMKGKSFTEIETEYRRIDHQTINVSLSTAPLRDNTGKVTGIMLIVMDITERKQAEEKVRYLSFHDKLTGLYNRAYFEEELKRLDTERQLPLTIIIGDANGLKLVNDAFGHQQGDNLLKEIARVLQDACRDEDMVSRWGGDEFAILLPRTSREAGEMVMERIRKKCQEVESLPIPLSIGLGLATKKQQEMETGELIKKAESRMYQNKLAEGKKFRMSVIASLLRELGEKYYEKEEHVWRMQHLALQLGSRLGCTEGELEDLAMAIALHDIGKLALPESILMKKTPLTPEEWDVIREHPERGYHVALSSNELAHIAPVILGHHERWDGRGYPQGLAGEEIPLLSRIIAVVDAYDVMTHRQVYKEAVSRGEALAEIKKHSGTQFDPRVAEEFLRL